MKFYVFVHIFEFLSIAFDIKRVVQCIKNDFKRENFVQQGSLGDNGKQVCLHRKI